MASPALPLAAGSVCADISASTTGSSMGRALAQPRGFGMAAGLITFCFGGHEVFPSHWSPVNRAAASS